MEYVSLIVRFDYANFISSKVTKHEDLIRCRCSDGKEIISAVSFSFAPNTIDFSAVFSKFHINSQGPVLGVLISIYVISAILLFWLRYMDRKAILQVISED